MVKVAKYKGSLGEVIKTKLVRFRIGGACWIECLNSERTPRKSPMNRERTERIL